MTPLSFYVIYADGEAVMISRGAQIAHRDVQSYTKLGCQAARSRSFDSFEQAERHMLDWNDRRHAYRGVKIVRPGL